MVEDRKNAALEKLKADEGSKTGTATSDEDKIPLPNISQFPGLLKERILSCRLWIQDLSNAEFQEVKKALYNCDTCDCEIKGATPLDSVPSTFFCAVFRLLQQRLTEGQLKQLLNNRSIWARLAGFMYVRLGVHQDRYWELLSDALLDVEEFVPFPDRSRDSMSEGKFVEDLLLKEKYCDFPLPRIAAAQRRIINERLVLFEQFRKRYNANLEVLDRFDRPGVAIEVCRIDGDWYPAQTMGQPTPGRRRVSLPIRPTDSTEELTISIGMIICPTATGGQDLTRMRGKGYQELLEKYKEQQRDAAVASGKDYCKNSGRHTVHAGGVTFIAGGDSGRGDKRKKDGDSDSEGEARAREAKKSAPNYEQQVKMAAIMEKYCSARGASAGRTQKDTGQVDGPDRLRLG